jgi:hypothetical protein
MKWSGARQIYVPKIDYLMESWLCITAIYKSEFFKPKKQKN